MIYLIIGVPGSGKSWVSAQLEQRFNVVRHDDYIGEDYARALAEADGQDKPVLGELPFGITEIKTKLETKGYEVVPVFILEDTNTLTKRYQEREGKDIPRGHLTRQETYRQRAKEYRAYSGTSLQVLEHLKQKGEKS